MQILLILALSTLSLVSQASSLHCKTTILSATGGVGTSSTGYGYASPSAVSKSEQVVGGFMIQISAIYTEPASPTNTGSPLATPAYERVKVINTANSEAVVDARIYPSQSFVFNLEPQNSISIDCK
jgi:hypothetical protein